MRAILSRAYKARRALLFYTILLVGGFLFGEALKNLAIPEIRPMNEPMINRIIMTALVIYVLAAAIPFVPGAEIGFALLFLFGGIAAPVVYVGMIGALLLSYTVSRLIPGRHLARALAWLGLRHAADFVERLSSSEPEQRAELISEILPRGLGRRMVNNRNLLLAIALNVPGNSLVGGGGGLAFIAGMSGLYKVRTYVAIILLAVAPVPLFFYLS